MKSNSFVCHLFANGPTRKEIANEITPNPDIRLPHFIITSSLFHPNWSIEIGVATLRFQDENNDYQDVSVSEFKNGIHIHCQIISEILHEGLLTKIVLQVFC